MPKDQWSDQQDPEQRIAELERQVEEAKRAAGRPPWQNAAGSPPPWPNAPGPSGFPPPSMPWGTALPKASRSRQGLPLIIGFMGFVVITVCTLLVFFLMRATQSPSSSGLSSNIPTSGYCSTKPPSTDMPEGGVGDVNMTGGDRTFACNDSDLTVKGEGHTLTLKGHCARLVINSMGTHVIVDSVDEINVEGMDNVIIYYSGSPQVNNQGVNNSVQQG
jgi:hypothetical protein